MSTGKGTKSIRKSQQGNDIIPSVGFLNTVAKHKATLGQTVINLGSLTVPTEATALGFVQPSGATLAAMDLSRYKNNVKVTSTMRGYMDNPLDYRVTGQQQITLQVGAFENEIFTITIEAQPRVGTNLVAAQPKVQSYTLPAGQTDIPVGPFTVNRNPGEDVGECMVIIDRVMMYRNTDNSAPGDGVEGDYQEMTGIIRMNTADLTNDRRVTLVWVGALVDNPQDSQLALIQSLAGQIDAMVPTLAALAGVSENTFQAAPNDIDLAAFGARVLVLEQILDLEIPIRTSSVNDGALQFSATTTPPVPGTVAVSAVHWDRDGEFANVRIEFRQTVAGSGGSGDYLFKMPANLKINLNKVTAYTTVEGWNTAFISNNNVGGVQVGNGSNEADGIVVVYDADYVRFFVGDASTAQQGAIGSGGFGLVNAGAFYVAEFRVPIVGWTSTQTVRQALGL